MLFAVKFYSFGILNLDFVKEGCGLTASIVMKFCIHVNCLEWKKMKKSNSHLKCTVIHYFVEATAHVDYTKAPLVQKQHCLVQFVSHSTDTLLNVALCV